MCHRIVRSLSTFVTAGAIAACGAPTDLAVNPLASSAPSVSATGAGGAGVFRFQNIVFILVFDAERQLLSAHMRSDICGDGTFNVVDVQRIVTPSQTGQILAQLKSDDAQVAVYHASSPADAGLAASINFFGFFDIADINQFCNFMAGPNLIAEGVVNRISTFSLTSFHARWTGTIQGVDGQDYRLTEIYHLNADPKDPNNPALFTELSTDILLHPIR